MAEPKREISLNEILTHAELTRAEVLYKQLKGSGKYASTVCTELIEPNIARINAVLGQENDPKYLAYMVEYVMMQLLGS